MREITEIILHCSATKASSDIGAKEIRNYHVNQNRWSDIGYHYVIRRDGTLEKGRDESKIGAHCQGHNADTIGICLVGGLDEHGKPQDNFTEEQFKTCATLIKDIWDRYQTMPVSPHNKYANKACPVFDVKKFMEKYVTNE